MVKTILYIFVTTTSLLSNVVDLWGIWFTDFSKSYLRIAMMAYYIWSLGFLKPKFQWCLILIPKEASLAYWKNLAFKHPLWTTMQSSIHWCHPPWPYNYHSCLCKIILKYQVLCVFKISRLCISIVDFVEQQFSILDKVVRSWTCKKSYLR